MDFMWVNALKASSTMTSTHAALGIALGIYHSLCPFRQQSSSIETRHLQKCHTMNHPILGIWLEQPWVLSHHLLQLYIPMWYTSPPEIGSTQTKQGTGAWRAGSAVTLGTSVLGASRLRSAGNSPSAFQFYMKLSPGIWMDNSWVINMYKPSFNWDAIPSMADSSVL